jgi:osmotically-inducible protein OsmY
MSSSRSHEPESSGAFAFLLGLGLGATLMYLLDPEQGRRRRALLRDQYVRGHHALQDATEAAVQAAANRTSGYIKRAQAVIEGEGRVDDAVLEARVRAAMGRIAADLKDVTVRAQDGCVILEGSAAGADAQELVACARHVRGVRDVDDRLRPPLPDDAPPAQASID